MKKDDNKKKWMSLSYKQRRVRLENIYKLLRKTAQKQLNLLDDFKNSKEEMKTERHSYFFSIVNSFWDDGDFALALGKNKFKHYAIYPTRTMMEKLLKILWFSNQKSEDQDMITKKELLRSCLLSHMRDKNNGYKNSLFEKHYKGLNDVNLPEISKVKISELNSFPKYEELSKKSGLIDADTFYDSYRSLSEMPHGNLLSIFMLQNGYKDQFYMQAMHNIVRFCIEMIKVVDFHLDHAMRQEIKDLIKLSEEISFK